MKKLIFSIGLIVLSTAIFAQTHFTLSPSSGCGSFDVEFNNLHPSGGYAPVVMQTTGFTYSWDFGNGQSSTLENPASVNYNFPGNYTVAYTATIDTIGFYMTKLTVTAIACDDPDVWPFTNDPDLYIEIIDGSSTIIHTTYDEADSHTVDPSSVNEVFMLPNIRMNNPPYYIRVRDKDSGDAEDNCIDGEESETAGTLVFLPPNNATGFYDTDWDYTNGGLQFTLSISKPVIIFNESQTVEVLPAPSSPSVNYTSFQVCEGLEIPELIATGDNIEWFDNEDLITPIASGNNYTPTISELGNYLFYATQTGTNGCKSAATIVEIIIGNMEPPVVENTDITMCSGASSSNINAEGNNISWYSDSLLNNWISDGNILNLEGYSEGNYQFYVIQTDSTGLCVSSPLEVNVNFLPALEGYVSVTNASCFNSADGSAVVSATDNGNGPFSFEWNDGATGNSATNKLPGEYTVTIIDANFCLQILNVIIGSPSELMVDFSLSGNVCYGSQDITIMADAEGSTAPYTYSWSTGATEDQITITEAGEYSVTVSDNVGCIKSETTSVEIPDEIMVSDSIIKEACNGSNDGEIYLRTSGGIPPYSYTWQQTTADSVAIGLHKGVYSVTVRDFNYCEKNLNITLGSVYDQCIVPASVLTPNADGLNDTWKILFIEMYPDADVKIFNRQGVSVYSSKGYSDSNAWDGTTNGKDLPMGSYFYVIDLNDGSNPLRGYVDIVR
ncbi:MAG: gliding motility-associated C-terminal domain-containing protein [Bacteroidales bacterium]|nr:gliding motility-associated C-terminal domain-containing protein [Bacteroidales bacterium]